MTLYFAGLMEESMSELRFLGLEDDRIKKIAVMRYEELTHNIIGCAMTYEGLGFHREMEMPIFYREEQIGTRRVDFFVEDCVMVELKAMEKIEAVHKAQAINYLEAYNIADGLLINFGSLSLDFKRLYNKKLVTPSSHPVNRNNP